MLDQRASMKLNIQGMFNKQNPTINSNPHDNDLAINKRPYNKRVNRPLHELTFEKYLDGKSSGKHIKKPRVPEFKKKDLKNKSELMTKKVTRDSVKNIEGSGKNLGKDHNRAISQN